MTCTNINDNLQDFNFQRFNFFDLKFVKYFRKIFFFGPRTEKEPTFRFLNNMTKICLLVKIENSLTLEFIRFYLKKKREKKRKETIDIDWMSEVI